MKPRYRLLVDPDAALAWPGAFYAVVVRPGRETKAFPITRINHEREVAEEYYTHCVEHLGDSLWGLYSMIYQIKRDHH